MVITVEEFLKRREPQDMYADETGMSVSYTKKEVAQMLLDFAELHRKECLSNAAQKAKKQFIPSPGSPGGGYFIVNKDSILNAYSKKNIR
jgi:hypothetical protein